MAWTTVISPAKINLFLELVARRDDGFHDLDTVMAKVGLCDRLSFRFRHDDRICLRQRSATGFPVPVWPVPLDERNLVWQAIQTIRSETGRPFGIDAIIEKQIPARAGLGGGSSNAVTTLVTVNRMLGRALSRQHLVSLANRLGSDLAFFFAPAAARCRGRGERVTPLPGFRRLWTVIGMPPEGLDTGNVFRHADLPSAPQSSQALCENWQSGPLCRLASHLYNRLQTAAGNLSPWIDRMKREFARVGCPGHLMSGSGTSYVGLFGERRSAARAAKTLQARMPQGRFYTVATMRTGADPGGRRLD